MTVPRWRSTSGRPAPTADSSSQRRPQRVKVSTCDGDSRTRSPSATTGSASDGSVSAYQSRGSAPRTPAAASRASWAGRRLPERTRPPLVGDGPAQVRDQRGQRQPAGGRARPLDLDAVARELGQEPGRALVLLVAARGGHHQQSPGAGGRDVEQAPFLGQQPGRARGDDDIAELPGVRSPAVAAGPAARSRPRARRRRAASRAAAGPARPPPAPRRRRPRPIRAPWTGARSAPARCRRAPPARRSCPRRSPGRSGCRGTAAGGRAAGRRQTAPPPRTARAPRPDPGRRPGRARPAAPTRPPGRRRPRSPRARPRPRRRRRAAPPPPRAGRRPGGRARRPGR